MPASQLDQIMTDFYEGGHDVLLSTSIVESGLDIPQFQQPRTVWLPGKVTADQTAFYIDLMKKGQATPESHQLFEKPRCLLAIHCNIEASCRSSRQEWR